MRHLPPRSFLPFALLLLLAGGRARADEVLLMGGTRLTGVVLKQDETSARLLQPGGDEVTLAAQDLKEVRVDADAPQGERVIRCQTDPKAPAQGLQVALVHLLHGKTGRRVDLVSAVHIADAAYYREVQRLLEQVDVVLYEMVKPRDAAPTDKPAPAPEGEPSLRDLQRRMGTWLGLAYQLDEISYDRPHFVHADLTLEEFEAAAGGSDAASPLKQMGPMLKLLEGMMKSESMGRMAKVMLGPILGNMKPAQMAALLGSDTAELVLDRRNEACVKCLLEQPPEAKTVAIFYGAAHLPDLEKRLRAEGYERAGARWLTAWDMRPAKETPKQAPAR